ncbi:homoserine kinase [Corynebacterium epidermidicanis]|uniref:Homoserine kinase n=1 Tax=Corynebacterium epidermidicanis TaxID=1050174 RepID=A0A0G3GQN4_9CORY|nr:homoserine kinase [Corynebacterium epidermidicanis]
MCVLEVGKAVTVSVPASSANLGPGFDSLGLSLGLFDDVTVEVIPSGLEMHISGEGADYLPKNSSHLVVRSIERGLAAAGCQAPGLRVSCHNRIPQSRGLGSSASAAVAGLAAAQALSDGAFDQAEFVHLAGECEGHPDNSSASVLGGAVVSWTEEVEGEPRYRAVRIPVHPQLKATTFVPDTQASTSAVRKVLPEFVPHTDARFNLARTGLLTYALQHDPTLLFAATEDKLHQGYRAQALPVTTQWVGKLRERGLAAFVSGAGPTALVLHTDPVPIDLIEDAKAASLRVFELDIASGVSVEELARD